MFPPPSGLTEREVSRSGPRRSDRGNSDKEQKKKKYRKFTKKTVNNRK